MPAAREQQLETRRAHLRVAVSQERHHDRGHALATLNLGVSYANGQGIARDLTQAKHWLQKAADLGVERAKDAVESRTHNGHGSVQPYDPRP